jgi:cyclophilin family peptidyl-prolyl cis-trans isomerase
MNELRWIMVTVLLVVMMSNLACSSKEDSERKTPAGANHSVKEDSPRWTGWGTPGSASAPATGESGSLAKPSQARPVVLIETSEGKVKVELWPDRTPETVANFLRYVDEGFYNGTIFHRVIKGFMIQGGGFTARMEEKKARGPIPNEATVNLRNLRGTVAMARMDHPHSAACEFFINLVDNPSLDHTDETQQGFGYAVFGRVVEGMEVVGKIAKVPTTTYGPLSDVPIQPVVIKRVSRVAMEPSTTAAAGRGAGE